MTTPSFFRRSSLGSLVLVVLFFLAGCTTQRDGRMYRAYHNTTAHFNGFYYARLAMEEADTKLLENREEDWDEVIPLFVYGSEKDADFLYPLMERAIEKCSRVVERHAMTPGNREKKDFKRPKLNKWIDDNYTIIGKAHFHKGELGKAEEVFKYLQRKHKDPDSQVASFTWLARTYMAQGNSPKTNAALIKATGEREATDALRADAFLVHAEFLLTQGNTDEAVQRIERAIPLIKPKKQRARATFVLAQLKQRTHKSQEAVDLFEEVVRMQTPYEMEFQARIQQAMAFERRDGNSEGIRDVLYDLLDDDKNEAYFDMVHYALATLDLEERSREQGMDQLKSGLALNSDNRRTRMKSFLRLADLNLEDREYIEAQAYYDSTLSNMDENHARYGQVRNNALSLTELVEHLTVVYENDSMLALCDLDEVTRLNRIRDILYNLQEALDAEVEAAELAAEQELQDALSAGGSETAWWPYNPRLRRAGYDFFYDRWGERLLEDNWRRSRKTGGAFSNIEDAVQEGVTEDWAEQGGELPSEEELMASLPCDSLERIDAEAAIATAMYQSGVVYKEKLEDVDNATETWADLVERLDESDEHPLAHFQLYRTYLTREETENYQNPFCATCNSQYWADQILLRYPNSEWALMVENPDFVDLEEQRRLEELAVYEEYVLRYYNQKDYEAIVIGVRTLLDSVPDNTQACRYKYLRAQCIGWLDGRAHGRQNYIEALKEVTASCDSTEQGLAAAQILQGLGVTSGALTGDKTGSKEAKNPKTESPFVDNPVLEHYIAVVIPVLGRNAEEVKAQLSDFCGEYFASSKLRVTSNLLDRENQLILIKQFVRKDRALDFYNVLTNNRESMINFNTSGYRVFAIHTENYVELFKGKDIEGYNEFFEATYLSE